MKLFDYTLDGSLHSVDDAIRAIHGLDWQEIEITEQSKPRHSKLIHSDFGISVYYDYGADYYFFEDIIEE